MVWTYVIDIFLVNVLTSFISCPTSFSVDAYAWIKFNINKPHISTQNTPKSLQHITVFQKIVFEFAHLRVVSTIAGSDLSNTWLIRKQTWRQKQF